MITEENSPCEPAHPDNGEMILAFRDNTARILMDPRLSSASAEAFRFTFLYAGSLRVSVGELLSEWSKGRLLQPCPHCGADVLVFRAVSGLSFSDWTGACTGCRRSVRNRTCLKQELIPPRIALTPGSILSPDMNKKGRKIVFSPHFGHRIVDHRTLPAEILNKIVTSGTAVSRVSDPEGRLVLTYDWLKQEGFDVSGKKSFQIRDSYLTVIRDASPDRQNARHVRTFKLDEPYIIGGYELEIRHEAVFVQERGINHLPRRYIVDARKILSFPDKQLLLECDTEFPFAILILAAAGEIRTCTGPKMNPDPEGGKIHEA